MERPYRDLAQLVLHTRQGIDYRVDVVNRGGVAAIVAAHGGCIEPLTSELATALAGDEYSLFDFHGLVEGPRLRVPIVSFSELRLTSLLQGGKTAVSVDGIRGNEPVAHVGGANQRLASLARASLMAADIQAKNAIAPKLVESPSRFFNQPSEGGIHIELTEALRLSMTQAPWAELGWSDPQSWTPVFHAFVQAVRQALGQYRAQVADDLDLTLERFERETDAIPKTLRNSYHDHSHN